MKITQFTHWLFYEGRFVTDFCGFIEALSLKLVELGIPVDRVRMNFRTLHPQVLAWSCIWDQSDGASVMEVPRGNEESEDFLGSPIQYVIQNEQPFRQVLGQLPDDSHSVLFELQASGLTDYCAFPVVFSNHIVNAATYSTKNPRGFTDECIDFLSQVSVLVSPFIETLATKRLARNLLETYIGPRTGRKILEGKIQRGDGEQIKAAIWFSDFRNFTQYTESLSMQQMLDTLNQYFEIVHNNVVKHGGEILRFIGDAMLIVFPVDQQTNIEHACSRALKAALSAQNDAIELNKFRQLKHEPLIEFGVGLHEGCVMYGNVGAPSRLDFTVMGGAVNRTARLESLTKELGCPVLVSAQFNRQIHNTGHYKGEFSVKGIKELLNVYAIY